MFRPLLALVVASAVVAAPVPKTPPKIDPGKPWEFPDLESKGWVEQKSGLKVWDVQEGDGNEVKAGDTVTVHYTGWLTEGTAFDSTKLAEFKHTEPITFGLNQVIKGWGEGVVGMKPGGVRRLVIPPEMGYGRNGVGKQIPSNATLVFVVEYVGPGK